MEMETLQHLMALAPPPMNIRGRVEQWDKLQNELSLEFPSDYKQLVNTYGSGSFAGFFGLANPFYSSPGDIFFLEFVRLRTKGIVEAQQSHPETAIAESVYPQSQ
jgi:hypothetical protein